MKPVKETGTENPKRVEGKSSNFWLENDWETASKVTPGASPPLYPERGSPVSLAASQPQRFQALSVWTIGVIHEELILLLYEAAQYSELLLLPGFQWTACILPESKKYKSESYSLSRYFLKDLVTLKKLILGKKTKQIWPEKKLPKV